MLIDPFLGACLVSLIAFTYGASVFNGLDSIAKTIDSTDTAPDIFLTTSNGDTAASQVQLLSNSTVASSSALKGSLEINNTTLETTYAFPSSSSPLSLAITAEESASSVLVKQSQSELASTVIFEPLSLLMRQLAAVTTLGSGCSLGPEGPSVEIGAGWSRVFADGRSDTSTTEKHHLFLAGTAAGGE